VKDNCSLFAYLRIFKPTLSDGVIQIFSLPTPVAMATNFGMKLTNSAPAKDNCTLFLPTPSFRARAMQWCHVNFSPLKTLVVMATNRFYSKTKLAAGSQEYQTLKRSC